jgi:FG-GAP-like repeat
MTGAARGIALIIFAATLCLAAPVHAARQILAVFPPDVLAAGADNVLRPAVPIVERSLRERLGDRFDVRPAEDAAGSNALQRRMNARALGASYILHGTLSRIGSGVSLDVTIAPTEDPGKGRTVVVSAVLADLSATSPRYATVLRDLGRDAAARVKELFFGTDRIGSGTNAIVIPKPEGMVSRSAPLPGEVVSVAMSDVDRDGKLELVAAYPTDIVIYRIEGDELREKARIEGAGPGLIHVDARDIDRDGTAEIVAVRYVGGRALSDIWAFDGQRYRKTASDVPLFLRTADLGPEGIVLLGQESDPQKGYRGPVFRLAVGPPGVVDLKERGRPLPLPDGVFLYAFTPLRRGKEVRYSALTSRDRLVYLDGAGKELWEGLDAVTGAEGAGDSALRRLQVSGHMAAVDLNGDGTDELVVMNDLVAAGTFFENLRVFADAELLCFAQAGDRLQLAWRTPQFEASARDLLAERTSRGTTRFGLASRDRGKVLEGTARWQMLWIR